MLNWNQILSSSVNVDLFRSFSRGVITKNSLLQVLAHTEISGKVRNVIRERGTERVREASRKALSRRNLL